MKKDAKVLSPAQAEQLLADYRALANRVAEFTVECEPAERLRLKHYGISSEPIILQVVGAAESVGISVPEATPEKIRSSLEQEKLLGQIHAEHRALGDKLETTILYHRHVASRGLTILYAPLKRLERVVPHLKARLKPVRDFFRRKPRAADTTVPPAEEELETG